MSIFDNIAIAGVAESDLGVVQNMNSADLMAQASVRAAEEAGINIKEVDGLFSSSAHYSMPTVTLAEYLGITPKYMDATSIGGASFVSLVAHAAQAISNGLCEVALIAYGSTQRTDGGGLKNITEPTPFEVPFGYHDPITAYALTAQRHMHEFGTTREQLSEVAVSTRKWASMNKKAFKRELITHEEVSNSTLISTPLTKLDCCLVTDGGAAIILTTKERAKSLNKKPVYIWGYGESTTHRSISNMLDLVTTAAAYSGKSAFEMAGVEPKDIDVAELYDAFSINVILFLEDLGFCEKGEGGHFISNGNIAPGGNLPVNTNGGGLSYCHPGMYGLFTIVEAARQLREECGERQVENCNIALAHGNGGVLSSEVTMVLSNNPKS
ncbi:acetyl-CoA acetyltransferase [Oceanobacillus halophilus]|uniref:Thiolase n=1 Tax=Oceanobacillus halophilus TaxID=930130 RepID=A0A495A7J4_9BACI|nr:acetyl-CoA acetyltransferase [Oceanobacillus halophilus]RKQ35767.1 thiolase [Oceanobacillus halophilus]